MDLSATGRRGSRFRVVVCVVGLALGGVGIRLAGETLAGLSLEDQVSLPTTYEAALETLAVQGHLPLIAAVPKEPVSWPADGAQGELTLRELLDLTARAVAGAWQEADGLFIVKDQQALAAEEASLPRNVLDARTLGKFLQGLTPAQQTDLFEDGVMPLTQLQASQIASVWALYSLRNLSGPERESWMRSGELRLRFRPMLLIPRGERSQAIHLEAGPGQPARP